MRPATVAAADAAALAHRAWIDLAAAMHTPAPPAWEKLHPDRRYAAVAAAGQAQRGADDEGWHAAYTGYLREQGWDAYGKAEHAAWISLLLPWMRLGSFARTVVRCQWSVVLALGRLDGYRPLARGGWITPREQPPLIASDQHGCVLPSPRTRDLHPGGVIVTLNSANH